VGHSPLAPAGADAQRGAAKGARSLCHALRWRNTCSEDSQGASREESRARPLTICLYRLSAPGKHAGTQVQTCTAYARAECFSRISPGIWRARAGEETSQFTAGFPSRRSATSSQEHQRDRGSLCLTERIWETKSAVQANRCAIEHLILHNMLCQGCILCRLAQARWEGNLLAQRGARRLG